MALLKLSVFALGIMPYITASIILQLLAVVIPRLETLRQEGQAGQSKITQYTRYLTVGLAILQATGIVALARSGKLFQGAGCTRSPPLINDSIFTITTMVICMTAGTSVIMWLGELVTDRGVGNGMSLMIFTTVISVIPGELFPNIYKSRGTLTFLVVLAVGIAIVGFVVFMEQAQRRIPVQYAKRMVGRRMYGGSSTYIPLKVNQAGVIPVIFASSMLYIPQLASSLFGNQTSATGWVAWVQTYLVRGDSPYYMLSFFILIILFTYFYVSITFNPDEVADNMKKSGGFIPGIRPGRSTAGVPRLRAQPADRPRLGVPGGHRADPDDRARTRRSDAELPIRRDKHPDRGGGGPRYGEADREPAPAAQLRGLPSVVRVVLVGPPGWARGHRPTASHLSIPKISTGDIFRDNVSHGTAPLGPPGPGIHGAR